MKAHCLIKGILALTILIFAPPSWAQKADADLVDQNPPTVADEPPKIPFIAAPQVLAKNIKKNKLAWINVLNEEHLVFKRSSKSRIYRGNVILLHSPGENPLHNRLINPLSAQLSDLGWNTFSTNIGFPDFPRKLKTNQPSEQKDSDQQKSPEASLSGQESTNKDDPVNSSETISPADELESTESKVERFFNTKESFQEYFSLICQETLKIVTISTEPTIFLANGEAAYWVLDCLKQMSPQTPIVIIQPKAPSFAHDNLDSTLESLENPIFCFSDNNSDDYFVNLIKQRNWQSTKQRLNQSALINSKINIENTSIAKLISGWVKSINSKPQ